MFFCSLFSWANCTFALTTLGSGIYTIPDVGGGNRTLAEDPVFLAYLAHFVPGKNLNVAFFPTVFATVDDCWRVGSHTRQL